MIQSAVGVPVPRIALVSGGLAMGGSTTFLINFAGELVQRGIPVEVFSLEAENPMASDFQSRRIPVFCMEHRRMIFEDRIERILRQLARFRPTVVISTLGGNSFEILRYLPKGVYRVGMGQSDDPQVYEMMKHYAPCVDSTALVSRGMTEKIKAMPEFVRVSSAYLPYGVPMCPEAEVPARTPSQPLRILYLGRLGREQKRVHRFPEILSQLHESGIPFHWTIAGDGGERSFLESNMKTRLPGQTVSFTGAIGYAEVPALLRDHDVYLLASDYEGLPLSLLEAMGYGLVPVVSDLPSGIREVVDDANGIRISINDVPGYARAIVHLHKHREELAAKSAAARQRVKKDFSVAAMTDRWLAAFPSPRVVIGSWPKWWSIGAPLPAPDKYYYSRPVRALRRLVFRFLLNKC